MPFSKLPIASVCRRYVAVEVEQFADAVAVHFVVDPCSFVLKFQQLGIMFVELFEVALAVSFFEKHFTFVSGIHNLFDIPFELIFIICLVFRLMIIGF